MNTHQSHGDGRTFHFAGVTRQRFMNITHCDLNLKHIFQRVKGKHAII